MTDKRSQQLRKIQEPDRTAPELGSDDLSDRIDAIDYMLVNEPVIEAPMGFADRVMAAIAAGIRPSSLYGSYRGVRLALGLALTVLFIAPLVVLGALTLGHWMADPNAFGQFVRGIVDQIVVILDGTVKILSASLHTMTGVMVSLQWMILIVALPISVLWLVTMWSVRRSQVVYRIPVEVL